MSKTFIMRLAVTLAGAALWVVPAGAGPLANGQACTVGQTNCVQDDPDDASLGHTVIPTGQTTTTSTNGDSGVVTATSGPTPAPAPAPGLD